MQLVFFLARRLFQSRQKFFPLLSVISFIGIALSTMMLVIVMGIMQGFEKELTQRWVRLHHHVRLLVPEGHLQGVTDPGVVDPWVADPWVADPLQGVANPSVDFLKDWLEKDPDVVRVDPFIEGEAIAEVQTEEEHRSKGVKIRGATQGGVQIGDGVMEELNLFPGLQESFTLSYPFGEVGPTGEFIPRRLNVKIDDVFHTGLYEWDQFRVLLPMDQARQLLGEMREEGLEIELKSLYALDSFVRRFKEIVPPDFTLTTFAEQNKRLYGALKMERWGMGLLFILFGLVASINFIGLLFLWITTKRRNWGILHALGLKRKKMIRLFSGFGLLFGGGAMAGGGVLGLLISLILYFFPISLPQAYYLDYLPVALSPRSLAVIFMGGVLLLCMAVAYPVWRGAKLSLMASLREE